MFYLFEGEDLIQIRLFDVVAFKRDVFVELEYWKRILICRESNGKPFFTKSVDGIIHDEATSWEK
jgi:hypothetical protein